MQFQAAYTYSKTIDADIFNIWNHAQFYAVDGNLSDGASFGRALQVHDPRLVQFALKLHF